MKMKFILVINFIAYVVSFAKMKRNLQNKTTSEKRLDFGDLVGFYNEYKDIKDQLNISSNSSNYSEKEPKVYKANCFLKMHNRFYDFNPLSSSCGSHRLRKNNSDNFSFYDFSFCNDILLTSCNRSGLFVDKTRCKIFAGSYQNDKTFESKKNSTGMRIILPKGEICNQKTKEKYQVIYDIKCNMSVNNITILNSEEFDPRNCTNVIKMASKLSCPTGDYYKAWYNQIGIAKSVIGYGLIAFGMIFLIFGEKLFDFFAALIIGICGAGFIYAITVDFFSINFIALIIISTIISFLLISCIHSCFVVIVGMVVGYLLGNIVYNIEILIIPGDPTTLYLITVIIFAIFGYILTKYIDKLIIIIATSLLGAYIFGLSILLGGYVEETYMIKLVKHNEIHQLNSLFSNSIFAYFFSMGLIAILGFFIQMGIRSEDKNEKEEKDNL